MRKRVLLICLVLFGTLFGRAQTKGVDGQWRGISTNPAGYVYSAEVTLIAGPGLKTCAVVGTGTIRGWIVWTLRKVGQNAPLEMAAKVGSTGKDSFSGEMVGEGFFALKGVEKEGPDNVAVVDVLDDGLAGVKPVRAMELLQSGEAIKVLLKPE